MSEMEEGLKRALAENGTYDPDRAAAIKKNLVGDFRSKLHWVERYMWVYLTICVCVAIFAFRAFDRSPTTKAQILFAIVFLVAFESTILIKVWYWVVNTKISAVKEIKLLRLAQPVHLEPGEAQVGEAVRVALPRWERILWYIVLIVSALIVPNLLLPTIGAFKAERLCNAYMTLEPDGGGTGVTKMEFRNSSRMPIMSLRFEAQPDADIRWLDEEGRPMNVVRMDDRNQCNIELPKPLMPGEWSTYTCIVKSPSLAKRQDGGLWVYKFDEFYSHDENDFAVNVLLPEGAESVSLQTEGEMEHEWKDGREIFVNGRRDRNVPFRFAVEYRLSAEAIAEPEAAEPATRANTQ